MLKGIYLANPENLWFLILIPLIFLLHYLTRIKKHPNLKLSTLEGFKTEKSIFEAVLRRKKNICKCIYIYFFIRIFILFM